MDARLIVLVIALAALPARAFEHSHAAWDALLNKHVAVQPGGRDYGKVFGNLFRDAFFVLLGRRTSLDGIEHETLRKPGAYDDPRERYFARYATLLGTPGGAVPVAFLDYDWALNDSPSSSRR